MVIIKNIGAYNRYEHLIEFLAGKYYAEYLTNDKNINRQEIHFLTINSPSGKA